MIELGVLVFFLSVLCYHSGNVFWTDEKTLFWSNGIDHNVLDKSFATQAVSICEKLSEKDNVGIGYIFESLGQVFASLHRHQSGGEIETEKEKEEREKEMVNIRDGTERFLKVLFDVLKKGNVNQQVVAEHVLLMRIELDEVLQSVMSPPKHFIGKRRVKKVCPEVLKVMNPRDIVTFNDGFLIDIDKHGGHTLMDVASVLMLFPGCDCVGDIPWPFLRRFVDAHKYRLKNAKQYEEELMKMCFVRLMEMFPEGQTSFEYENLMPRMSAFLNSVPSLINSNREERLSKLMPSTRHLIRLMMKLLKSHSHSLKPFPSFQSLKSGRIDNTIIDRLRRQSIASEHLRLTQVVDKTSKRWRSSDLKVDVLEWKRGMELNLEKPTVFKNTPALGWKAMEWSNDVETFVKDAGMKQFNVKLLLNTSKGVHRSPLGQGFTFKANALSLFGKDAVVGEQPFYLTQAIDKEKNPNMWKAVEVEGKLCAHFCPDDDANDVPNVNVWAGSEGVIAPLHYDPFHNFFFQVRGRKEFLLFPPKFTFNSSYLHPKIHVKHRNLFFLLTLTLTLTLILPMLGRLRLPRRTITNEFE